MSTKKVKKVHKSQPIPAPRTYNVRLPVLPVKEGSPVTYYYNPVKATFGESSLTLATQLNGKKITLNFTFGTAEVERKVRVYNHVIKDKNGKPIIVKVPLPSTTVVMTVNGTKFTAHSFCKPPDVWDKRMGIKFAVRGLFRKESVAKHLNDIDYEPLVKICLTKPPTPGQIKRAQKIAAKKTAAAAEEAKA